MNDPNTSAASTLTSSRGMDTTSEAEIEAVARKLARYNQEADLGITASYLFPSKTEIRLIHLDENSPQTTEGEPIAPFYFGPDRIGGITYPSAIALIRPEEKGQLPLPTGWGTWDDAALILREAE